MSHTNSNTLSHVCELDVGQCLEVEVLKCLLNEVGAKALGKHVCNLILSACPLDFYTVLLNEVINEIKGLDEVLRSLLRRVVASNENSGFVVAEDVHRDNVLHVDQEVIELG